MSFSTPNTVETGGFYPSDCAVCPTCVSNAVDPIRTALVSAGVSATDLAAYDNAAPGDYVVLNNSAGTVALVQSVRTAALAAVSGSYRIGNTDAAFDTTPTGSLTNVLTASTTVTQDRLTAGSVPFIYFVVTSTSNTDLNSYQIRRSASQSYQATVVNAMEFNDIINKTVVVDNSLTRPYSIVVFKQPYDIEGVDKNTAMYAGGNIGTNSAVTNSLVSGPSSKTLLTTTSAPNRQWQAICAPASSWTPKLCSLDATVGTATNAYDGNTFTVTFTVYGDASANGALVENPLVTATGATISNYSKPVYNAATGAITFTATVTMVDDPALVSPNTKPITYNVSLGTYSTTAAGLVEAVPNFASSLTGSSLTDYNAAAMGELVQIDATNYNALTSLIVSTAGVTNAAMNSQFGTANGVDGPNMISGPAIIPSAQGSPNFTAGARPFLVRLRVFGTSTTQAAGRQLGYYTNDGGANKLGTAISSKHISRTVTTSDANGYVYYVVKNPYVIVPGTDKAPRIFSGANTGAGQGIRFTNTVGWSMYQDGAAGDVTDPIGGNVSANFGVAVQVHSMT